MQNKVTVEEWVERFRAIGLDDAAMEKWHRLLSRKTLLGIRISRSGLVSLQIRLRSSGHPR